MNKKEFPERTMSNFRSIVCSADQYTLQNTQKDQESHYSRRSDRVVKHSNIIDQDTPTDQHKITELMCLAHKDIIYFHVSLGC